MKKLKNTIKRIATLGLTVVLLTNSFPAAAFAAEIDGTEPAIVMDEELPESSEEVSAGESGEGASDKVLSEGSEEINGKDAAGEKAEGNSNDQLSDKGSSDEENDTTGDAVTPSYETDEDADKDSNEDNEEYPAFEQSKSIDGVKITVSAEEGVFPEGAVLSVEKVTIEQEKQAEKAVENKRSDEQNVAVSYAYDIKVLDKDGNEIQPADESKVKVSFKLEEVADDNLTTNVYHITEKEDSEEENTADADSGELVAEKLEVETDGDTAFAETDGFSLYTVEFTYNDLQYVLPGDSEVELSQILSTVGLSGEVTEVSVSDSSLFSAAKNDSGEWIVTAHKAFSSKEWMKVTINDVLYEITVTDDNDVINIEATGQTISDATTWENCTVNITGSGTVTFSERITISGTVTLNLGEGATLKADKGIEVHEGNTLTIDGMGQLDAASTNTYLAPIGGGEDIVNAGTIIICGGTVNATTKSDSYAAAIGGGYKYDYTAEASQGGSGGTITINGGTVTATQKGNAGGAAIGGGEHRGNSGKIHIAGGTVIANASTYGGAGIGGGTYGSADEIIISGGEITAKGSPNASAIGGGCYAGSYGGGGAGTISITGGKITATIGKVGIGGVSNGGVISISGGQVTAGIIGIEGTIDLSWTELTDFIQASSFAGTISFAPGKRFYYDGTTNFATAEGLYKQEKKIVPVQANDKSLLFSEIKMQRYYVTANGTEVNVSYEVYDYNGNKLTKGTDYTAVIKNSSGTEVSTFNQLGDYTLTVTGAGNYEGANSFTFSLVENDPSLTQDGSEYYVNFPNPGRKNISLGKNQTIKVYDSEGKNDSYVACDGFLIFYAPDDCILEVTGKTDAGYGDENYLNAYEGDDETALIASIYHNTDNISFASSGNRMLLRFNAPKTYEDSSTHYGLELTVSSVPATTHSVTVGTAEHGLIASDKTTAQRNETVTLTVTPEGGYLLKNITVKETGTENVIETVGAGQWCSGGNTVSYRIKDKNVTFVPVFTDVLTSTNLTLTMEPTGTKEYIIPDNVRSFCISGSADRDNNTTATLQVNSDCMINLTGSYTTGGAGKIVIFDGSDTSANKLLEKISADVSINNDSSSNYMTIQLSRGSSSSSLSGTITVLHTHRFTYSLNGATITATCSGGGICNLTDRKASVTIAEPTGDLAYDGTEKPAALTGDTEAFGNPTITYTKDGAALTGNPKDAGTYTAYFSVGGKTASVEYKIAKAELTSLAVDITGWTYGGTANEPSVTDNTGNGEVTYEYKAKDAADNTYSTAVPTAAGNYTVRATVAESANYNGKAVTKNFTIAKKAVTITAKAQSVEVGGELSQDVSNATLTGALDGHTLASITLTPSSVASIGTGTITASDAHIKNGNTDVTDNYEISYTEGALTVTSPQVYISGITAKNKEYNGNTDATIEGTAVIKTVRDNNDVTGLSAESIVAAFEDANAGSNKAVTISSATLTGEGAANYTLNIEKTNEKLGLKANITAKSVTVTVTAMNRDYDPDSTTVELNAGSVNDVVGGDNVTVDVSSATGTMENADAGTSKPVTVTGVKLGGAKAGNYKISEQPTGVTVTISKIGYTGNKIAAATVRSGQITTDATLTLPALPAGASYAASGTVSGTTALISNHSISGTTLTYSTTSQNDGTSATITIGVTGATNYNDYDVVVTVTARDKDEAGVSITGGDKEVIYGADDFALSGTVTYAGTGTKTWTWTSSDPSVAQIEESTGMVTIKKPGSATITAKYESDTTIGEATIMLTVNKKTLGITWSNTSFTYDGSAHKPTATISGVKSGDTCTVSVSGEKTDVGSGYTAAAALSGTDSGKYQLPSDKTSCSFTINKASINGATVTLGTALTYNGSEQTQTVSKVELNGNTVPSSAYTVTGNRGTNAGNYTLTITAKDDSNYTGSVSKAFTIAKKAITPTVSVTGSYSYTGSAITPTYTVKNENTALATSDYTASVKDNINAGEGKLAIAAATSGNYSFDPLTVSFTIAKAAHENVQAGGELKYGLSGTVALASYIEAGGSIGTISVSDASSVLSGTPSINGTTLSYSFADNAENVGKTAVVTVPVKDCTNYADYSILVTLTVIDCAHEHTEIRNVKTASCTEQGYTGDTYCKDCGKKLQSGEAIPIDPDNHSYDDGVITKQPTIFAEGIRTYTCTRCHHTYTETVPKVDDGEDHSDLIEDITDEEGKTKAEVKTEDKEDGSKETTVTVGGQEVEKTVTDAEGNETVETRIWIGGLKSSYTYTGSAIKPSFHVYDGTKKLSSGTDYSVSYKNNTKVGTSATITISFKGNYKGTAQEKVKFAIIPAVLGEDVKALDLAVAGTGKLQKPAPTVVWTSTGKTVSGKNFSFAYKDAAGNDVSGVKGEGTYTVTVTPKNGSFTGSMSATITVTSKKLLLSKASVTLKPNKYTYTGDPIIPASGTYTLKLNGATLTENTDYVVASVTNNINAGTATITFAAKEGNAAGYAGTKSATFKIVKGRELKQGDGFTYSYSSSVPYAKGGAKPSVVVKDGEDTLVLNKDYTVSYSKNTAVTNGATAIMTVKGKGNYKGSVKLYYAVTTQNIANLKDGITVADKPESKKGYKNPSVTIIDLDGKKLKSGTDFKIGTDYSEPDADGKVTVTVFGNGKYNGSIQVSYRYIKAAQQLSKVKSMKSISAQTYTGKAIRLKTADLTGILYVGNKKSPTYLVPGTDFVVLSYSNNTKAGTAKVTLKGMGNYGGTRTLTFKIKQKKGDYKGSLVDGEWKN